MLSVKCVCAVVYPPLTACGTRHGAQAMPRTSKRSHCLLRAARKRGFPKIGFTSVWNRKFSLLASTYGASIECKEFHAFTHSPQLLAKQRFHGGKTRER